MVGWAPALVAVAATIALAGYLPPSGLATDDAMMSGQPDAMSSDGAAATFLECARYDADSIDARVQAAVIEELMRYWEAGPAAFEVITPEEALSSRWKCNPLTHLPTHRSRKIRQALHVK